MIPIWQFGAKAFRRATWASLAIAKLADSGADFCLERWMRAVYCDDRPLPDTVAEMLADPGV